MNVYFAKYYPIINGKEIEYSTTVEADDKISAEKLVRNAFIDMLKIYELMINTFNLKVVNLDNNGNCSDKDSLKENIEYAKHNMRVEII